MSGVIEMRRVRLLGKEYNYSVSVLRYSANSTFYLY